MSDAEIEKTVDLELKLFLEAVYSRFQFDFRGYAKASLKRRLLQALSHYGCETLSGLQERLLREPELFNSLLAYLTVQVTELVREPQFFLEFRKRIVPILQTYPSIKIWVAGCSTGEEAYSFALILQEEGLLARSLIYATDINAQSLRTAEEGVFPLDRMATFTENHRLSGGVGSLSAHYTAAYGSAIFDRALAKKIVFADHSLATDTVFAEVHVVSCRNVLIYFDQALQDRAIGLFHDALCHKGFLGLGSKETIRFTKHAKAFTDFSPEQKWYQRA